MRAHRLLGSEPYDDVEGQGLHARGRAGLKRVLFGIAAGLALGLAVSNPQAGPSVQGQVCQLLTKEEVLEALKASEAKNPGRPPTIRVEKVEEDESLAGEKVCIYFYSLEWNRGDKWDHLIRVSYQRDKGALEELKEVKSKMGRPNYPVERLPGMGEEAYWVDNIRLYVWVKGGLLKIDHGFRGYQKDLSILLAKRALARIR